MRILQIVYSLGAGGAERFVVDLSNEMSKEHDVFLCVVRDLSISASDFYIEDLNKEIKIINPKIPEGFSIKYIFKFYDIIKEIKPDIIHCHQNLVNYIFPLTYFFKGLKYFHTIHSIASSEVSNKLEYYLRKYFYSHRLINAITISHETSESFSSYYNTKNFSLIYNGRLNLEPTENFESVKQYFSEIKKKKNGIVFLHVGRCVLAKNQQMLIKVFNKLIYDGYSVILFIIGAKFDSSLGLKLKSLAKDGIYFIGVKHNVADYYLNSDAFCLSSKREGMPITLIEAFSSGCVPICTPVGGMKDVIENKKTGYLAVDESEESYYNCVIEYLNNPYSIKRNYLIKYYQENFSIEKCVQEHINLYQKM